MSWLERTGLGKDRMQCSCLSLNTRMEHAVDCFAAGHIYSEIVSQLKNGKYQVLKVNFLIK